MSVRDIEGCSLFRQTVVQHLLLFKYSSSNEPIFLIALAHADRKLVLQNSPHIVFSASKVREKTKACDVLLLSK